MALFIAVLQYRRFPIPPFYKIYCRFPIPPFSNTAVFQYRRFPIQPFSNTTVFSSVLRVAVWGGGGIDCNSRLNPLTPAPTATYDVPRGAKICISIQKKKKDDKKSSVSIFWLNISVYDHSSLLRQGMDTHTHTRIRTHAGY